MVALHPFSAETLTSAWAGRVAAPAVDAMGPAELAAVARREPWSFLHVTGTDPDRASNDDAATHLRRLRAAGAYRPWPRPGLALLRLSAGGHSQLGVVGGLSLDDARAGRLRRHEATAPAKVAALVAHRARVGVEASPLSVAYAHAPGLAAALDAVVVATPPEVAVTTADGVRHELWPITDPHVVARVTAAVGRLGALYVLDGHHRLAAALRLADQDAAAGDDPGGRIDAPARLLGVLFAEDDVRVCDYRRVLPRPPGAATAELLAAVRARFVAEAVDDAAAAQPRERGTVALRLDGAWYRLRPHPRWLSDRLPDRLDEVVVQRHLIASVFAGVHSAVEPAVTYVPGTASLADTEGHVDPRRVIVALHPLPLPELRAVADAGLTLPAKSTYVTPKPGAGLILPRRAAATAA